MEPRFSLINISETELVLTHSQNPLLAMASRSKGAAQDHLSPVATTTWPAQTLQPTGIVLLPKHTMATAHAPSDVSVVLQGPVAFVLKLAQTL